MEFCHYHKNLIRFLDLLFFNTDFQLRFVAELIVFATRSADKSGEKTQYVTAPFRIITKTCPCNIQVKKENFHQKIFDIFLTHNLCFGAKIRKIGIPLHTPVLLYKSGV